MWLHWRGYSSGIPSSRVVQMEGCRRRRRRQQRRMHLANIFAEPFAFNCSSRGHWVDKLFVVFFSRKLFRYPPRHPNLLHLISLRWVTKAIHALIKVSFLLRATWFLSDWHYLLDFFVRRNTWSCSKTTPSSGCRMSRSHLTNSWKETSAQGPEHRPAKRKSSHQCQTVQRKTKTHKRGNAFSIDAEFLASLS